MTFIITGIVTVLLSALLWFVGDSLELLYDICFNLTGMVFSKTDALETAFFSIGIALIIMKFLKKGFEIYVLWTDGDPDSDPIGYLVNFIKAIVVACTFTFVFEYFVIICRSIVTELVKLVTPSPDFDLHFLVSTAISKGLAPAICLLVFLIAYVILLVSFYLRGIEILILKVGMPIACVGLLDNDKGVFKAYVNQLVKVFLTTIIQIILCNLGLSLMLVTKFDKPMNAFWGIACMIMAITTPKLLREFLVPAGGGGSVSNTIYQTTRIASLAKSFIK